MFRKIILALIVAIGLAVLVFWAVLRIGRNHLVLNTCFEKLEGLQVGGKVRMEGVDVGIVRSVNVPAGDANCPNKLELDLWIPKNKRVPRDGKTELATAGVLGETYVEIVNTFAGGPPVENGGTLASISAPEELTPEATSKLVAAVGKLADRMRVIGNPEADRRVVHLTSPDYPESARIAQISGVVIVRATIGEDGKVLSTKSEGPSALRDVAEQNCKEWAFSLRKPGEVEIFYDFRLQQPTSKYKPTAEVSFDLPEKVTIISHPTALSHGQR